MSGPRVLSREEQQKRLRLEPNAEAAWAVLAGLGLILLLIGWMDTTLLWIPLRFGNPEWEFGTTSGVFESLPLATVGLGILVAVGVRQGRIWLVAFGAVVASVAWFVMAVSLALFLLTLPVAVGAIQPELKYILARSGGKTLVSALIYMTAYGVVGIWLLRMLRRTRRVMKEDLVSAG